MVSRGGSLDGACSAELLIYPTAIGWDRTDNEDEQQRQLGAWELVQRGHAVANGLPVLVCNRVGYEASPTKDDPGIEFWGNSFIVGPQGELLAKADIDATVLTAEVSLRRSEDVRRIWPFLRDRRIDSYNEITKRFID
jgi:N-carbamoylputrescine amidase